jgi:hypothetical protein
VDVVQTLTLFYVIPIALWLALIGVLFRVWWTRRLEESLAYLVFLRQRRAFFTSLIVGLAALHVLYESVRISNGFGWISNVYMFEIGIGTSVAGGVLVFLFAWRLLWRGAPQRSLSTVLDLPEPLLYSLGVVDRTESGRDPRPED